MIFGGKRYSRSMKRKNQLAIGEVYHVFSRSIANFKIFNCNKDYQRLIYLLKYFQIEEPPTKFSYFMRLEKVKQEGFLKYFHKLSEDQTKIVQIIGYCLMPTHIHLILKQLSTPGISLFICNILNSYSRYFNTKHHRKGPLWQSKFENVLVEDDEQLLHLTRYIHLNPVTASFVDQPEKWLYSSYKEYSGDVGTNLICRYEDLLDFKPYQYRKFVKDRIAYQQELSKIKNIILES